MVAYFIKSNLSKTPPMSTPSWIPLARRFFPFIPTLFVICLALIGHASRPACLSGLFGSSPIWYWVSFHVALYPFDVLWPSASTPHLFLSLASLALALVEAGAERAGGGKAFGWAAGYSMHTLVVLLLVLKHRHDARKDVGRLERDSGQYGSLLAVGVTTVSVVLQLLSAWGYDPKRHRAFQALIIYALLPAQAVVLFIDRKRSVRFSYGYCVFYAILGMRVPDFIAFNLVRLLAAWGEQNSQLFDDSDALRYAVSFGYLMFMSLYIRLLKRVVESMSAPNTFPRFLFHAQFYTLATYYVLISTARRMDVLFFVMVVIMNVYYVLNNTGILTDFMDRFVWSRLFTPSATFKVTSSAESEFYHINAGHAHVHAPPVPAMAPSGGYDARHRYAAGSTSMDPSRDPHTPQVFSISLRNQLVALAFRIKLAEQDVYADSTALVAIPSLITFFAWLAARDAVQTAEQLSTEGISSTSLLSEPLRVVSIRVEHYDGVPLDLQNLWIRFGIMFAFRLASSFASRQVFAVKIRNSLRKYVAAAAVASTEGRSNRNAAADKNENGQDADTIRPRGKRPSLVNNAHLEELEVKGKAMNFDVDVVKEPTSSNDDEDEEETTPLRSFTTRDLPLQGKVNSERKFQPGAVYNMSHAGSSASPADFEVFTDAAIRTWFSTPGGGGSMQQFPKFDDPAIVDQFQTQVLLREFPNVFLYFVFVIVLSLFSLFQNPSLPTRYAFCSFVAIK